MTAGKAFSERNHDAPSITCIAHTSPPAAGAGGLGIPAVCWRSSHVTARQRARGGGCEKGVRGGQTSLPHRAAAVALLEQRAPQSPCSC